MADKLELGAGPAGALGKDRYDSRDGMRHTVIKGWREIERHVEAEWDQQEPWGQADTAANTTRL
jgi:hypothetical protein